MTDEYQKILSQAQQEIKSIKKVFVRLRKMRKGDVDKKIHHLHREAFTKIDCLECANCCKTTGPLFTNKDINSIADHLNLTPNLFINKYLRIDEDNDYVLQTVPCSFLRNDNYCSIYEFRPKACREYPHTDRINQLGILKLTEKNVNICPAVADIFLQLTK
jgi:Fe-S-cluster containining protein